MLGKHEGMNGCPFIEISELLKENNELIVELKAANWEIWETFDGQKNPGRVIKPINWAGVSGAEPFFPLGIWQGIRLDIVPKIHLERPLLTFENISGDDATLSFSCELFANSHSLKKEMHYWHNQIVSRGKAKTDLSPVKESNSVEYLEGYCFNTLKLFGLLMENHFQKKIGLLYGLIKLI
ncbi:MAG: hypothetical protein HC819_11780 [Cyclobacteriaceae bacterium]|nr:hypothetical protein [Cyclobacteriaceae bacterium]